MQGPAPFILWLLPSSKGSSLLHSASRWGNSIENCIGDSMGCASKWRPEVSYMATPNGKYSLDVSLKDKKNGFAETSQGLSHRRSSQ